MQDIESEAARMGRMVDDLLTLARADAGQNLELEMLNVAEIAEQVGRQATKVYPERDVAVLVEQSRPVPANADAITQLCWILVNNAARHTDKSGHITIEVAPQSGALELRVTDDGPGIPESELTRIFERFYNVETSRSEGGTGLGLAIASWIVGQHKGSIAAANVEPHGARFTVRLPFSADS
jgi:signal transduction histidine kinase